jgi:hypothetical protein
LADITGLPLTIEDENPKLLVVDLLNSNGVCYHQNFVSSKQVKVNFETLGSQKSMDRVQAEFG